MSDAAAPTPPEPLQVVAPPDHSRAGHRVHGWCSLCPGREVWEELLAWRTNANRKIDIRETPDRVPSPKKVARG